MTSSELTEVEVKTEVAPEQEQPERDRDIDYYKNLKVGDEVQYYALDRRLATYLVEERSEKVSDINGQLNIVYTLRSTTEDNPEIPGLRNFAVVVPQEILYAQRQASKNLKPFKCIGTGVKYSHVTIERTFYAETESEANLILHAEVLSQCDDVDSSESSPWSVEPLLETSEES
jgi:capsule polysaccharide export protein KpsE/RkpR